MAAAIQETNFELPGQVGEVYHGKVGDTYTVDSGQEDPFFVVVRTDRISASDVVLPQLVPQKGAVLSQMAAALLEGTADVAPNWLVEQADPNAVVGLKATPLMVEMIMRDRLLGSAWKAYDKKDMRDLCGHTLPEGMHEYQPFDQPLLTPTTKATEGHDENISLQQILEQGLATEDQLEQIVAYSTALFARGQAMAAERDLELVDTKYEFGVLASGAVVVIDEVHTPDSSRYFYAGTIDAYLDGEVPPAQMSKEFVRKWLNEHGFEGTPDGFIPEMPEEFIAEVTQRYAALGEQMLGRPLDLPDDDNPLARIEENVVRSLDSLANKN